MSDYAHQINAWLEKESQRVSDVAEEIGYQNYDTTARDSLYPYLVDCIERMPEMFAIYVGCLDNYSSFSDGWIPDADYTIVDRQWYQDAASDGAVIIEPYIDRRNGHHDREGIPQGRQRILRGCGGHVPDRSAGDRRRIQLR